MIKNLEFNNQTLYRVLMTVGVAGLAIIPKEAEANVDATTIKGDLQSASYEGRMVERNETATALENFFTNVDVDTVEKAMKLSLAAITRYETPYFDSVLGDINNTDLSEVINLPVNQMYAELTNSVNQAQYIDGMKPSIAAIDVWNTFSGYSIRGSLVKKMVPLVTSQINVGGRTFTGIHSINVAGNQMSAVLDYSGALVTVNFTGPAIEEFIKATSGLIHFADTAVKDVREEDVDYDDSFAQNGYHVVNGVERTVFLSCGNNAVRNAEVEAIELYRSTGTPTLKLSNGAAANSIDAYVSGLNLGMNLNNTDTVTITF